MSQHEKQIQITVSCTDETTREYLADLLREQIRSETKLQRYLRSQIRSETKLQKYLRSQMHEAQERAAKYREERDLARSEVDRLRRKLDEAQNPCLSFGPPTALLETPQVGDVVITPAGRVGKLVEKRRDGIGMVRFTETVEYEVPLTLLRRHLHFPHQR